MPSLPSLQRNPRAITTGKNVFHAFHFRLGYHGSNRLPLRIGATVSGDWSDLCSSLRAAFSERFFIDCGCTPCLSICCIPLVLQ
jgi:hypothetical protein